MLIPFARRRNFRKGRGGESNPFVNYFVKTSPQRYHKIMIPAQDQCLFMCLWLPPHSKCCKWHTSKLNSTVVPMYTQDYRQSYQSDARSNTWSIKRKSDFIMRLLASLLIFFLDIQMVCLIFVDNTSSLTFIFLLQWKNTCH
jgi:hypothetical protein